MRILFIPNGTIPVHATILKERPLGGTESGLVLLAEALALQGHDVRVITDFDNPPLSNPLYLPRRALSSITETDIMIVIRQWDGGFNHIKCKKRLFWTGDAFDQPQTLGLGDKRVISHYDALLAVSNWQAETLSSVSGFPKKKCWVIKNGIDQRLFETPALKRDPYQLIYTSTPYRGLDHLIRLFPRIQAKVPQASLHVYSDYGVYKGADGTIPPGHENAYKNHERLKQLAQSLPEVHFKGNVLQAELAEALKQSSIFAYPNTFPETSCISALEAMAAGCVVVTSKRAALPETIGTAGVLISGEPGEKKYDDAFVETVSTLLTEKSHWENLSVKAQQQTQHQGWQHVATRLSSFLSDSNDK